MRRLSASALRHTNEICREGARAPSSTCFTWYTLGVRPLSLGTIETPNPAETIASMASIDSSSNFGLVLGDSR